MATTTNYAWETPDDTDLVKDGAAAIRTLGSSVDTTTKALNPSTTLGDIEYRSATANTNTRLGIGSNGQYLSVSGGVPAWANISAGGMTLLSTTTLSGASTTISSISQDYTRLLILGFDMIANFDGEITRLDLNGTGNSHYVNTLRSNNATPYESSNTTIQFGNSSSTTASSKGQNFMFNLYNYTSTGSKFFDFTSNTHQNDNSKKAFFGSGSYKVASAVTSVKFTVDSASWSGGTIQIYGVK
jgi:hypothetical protein